MKLTFWRQRSFGSILMLTSALVLLASARNASGQWSPTASPTPSPGTNIYYNSGNVGVGTTNPSVLVDTRKDQNDSTMLRVQMALPEVAPKPVSVSKATTALVTSVPARSGCRTVPITTLTTTIMVR